MSDILIQAPHIQSTISIPTIFFDTYMPKANGEFLKVYLYIFRWCHTDNPRITITSIADTFSLTESDVMRALRYWQDEGLIQITTDPQGNLKQLALVQFSEKSETEPIQQNPLPAQPQKEAEGESVLPLKDYTKPAYSMKQIQQFNKDNNGEQLFLVIQQYIGRPLNQTDMNTIVFFHEQLGFSTDLIEYLVEYCVASDHRSFHYMEKVAINWAQEGVDTVSKAKNRSIRYGRTYYTVLKTFGIQGRGPAPAEADYIKRWVDEYGFSQTLIIEACNRTITQIHQPSFNYADKILKDWLSKKAMSLDQVKKLDAAYEQKQQNQAQVKPNTSSGNTQPANYSANKKPTSNRFHNFNERTYNYSDLEQRLVQKRKTSTEQ